MDLILARVLDELFLDGGALHLGSGLFAVMTFFHPGLRPATMLPLSRRALQGWARRCPPRSRDPMPWVCACACLIAEQMMTMNERMCALAVILMFTLYLRPGELIDSFSDWWIPPVTSLGHGYRHWSIIVRPTEGQRPAKNLAFHCSVALDRPA